MNKDVLTVFKFELATFLKSKGYLLTTILISAAILLAFFIPGIVSSIRGRDAEPAPSGEKEILLIDDRTNTAGINEALSAALPSFDIRSGTKDDLADDVYGVIRIDDPKSYVLTVERMSMFDVQAESIREVLASFFRYALLRNAGVDDQAIGQALTPPSFSIEEIASDVGKTQAQSYATTYFVLMVLFMMVQIYGQIVAGSVAAEKVNRTMELLISSTKPVNLIVGKVFGVGVAGIIQMFFFLSATVVGYNFNKEQLGEVASVFEALNAPGEVLGRALLFMMLAYFTFAFLYSAFGSLVARSEDVNRVTGIVALPLMIAFFLAIFMTMMPESPVGTVASFIPYVSPLVLFVRLSMITVPFWQVVISLSITVLTLIGTAWMSAAIYRLGVLMYGNAPTLKRVFEILRASRKGATIDPDTTV
jgi:ABC-2 type transport system permease protein